jgi:hypothetical protein
MSDPRTNSPERPDEPTTLSIGRGIDKSAFDPASGRGRLLHLTSDRPVKNHESYEHTSSFLPKNRQQAKSRRPRRLPFSINSRQNDGMGNNVNTTTIRQTDFLDNKLFYIFGEGRSPRLSLWVLIEDLVRRDQGSDDVCRWFEALEKVLVVSQPLPYREAFNVLGLHVGGSLGHR